MFLFQIYVDGIFMSDGVISLSMNEQCRFHTRRQISLTDKSSQMDSHSVDGGEQTVRRKSRLNSRFVCLDGQIVMGFRVTLTLLRKYRKLF